MSDKDVAVEQDEVVEDGQEDELSEEQQEQAKLKEAISVKTEEIGSLRLKITVTIPSETLDERRGKQFSELKRDSTVPGFRKGHAPLRLVEKRFATDVGEQLKTQLVSSGYLAAIEKEDLKPLGDPLFWVKEIEERIDDNGKPHKIETEKLAPIDKAVDCIKLPTEGPLTFACEVELKPEFELPELKGIPVERPQVQIDDEDVEAELRRMLSMRGTFMPVEDGVVEVDDMLYADFKMSVDGEVVVTEENFDLAARDLRVKGIPLIGFGDAVVGKKLGEVATFEAEVPDDHDNIGIRGKTAHFEFTLQEIKRLELPEMDEEFLASLGLSSEEELRSTMRSSLESQLDMTIKRAMREQISEHLVANTQLDIPEGLSQRQTDRSIRRRMIEMYQAGVPQPEIEKIMDELRSRAHHQVTNDLKLFFVLEKIAEEREIEVSEEQINGAIAQIAQQSNRRFDRVRDELSKSDGLTTLYIQIRDQRVLETLLEDALITETAGPKKKQTAEKSVKKKAKTVNKVAKAATAQVKKEVSAKKSGPKKTPKKKAGKKSK